MKNKLLTAILALFLPLVSAGQQSLSAFLLTSGPNSDPGTLVCTLDDVGGIGFVAADVRNSSPTPISSRCRMATTVLPAVKLHIEQEEIGEPVVEHSTTYYNIPLSSNPDILSTFCNQ